MQLGWLGVRENAGGRHIEILGGNGIQGGGKPGKIRGRRRHGTIRRLAHAAGKVTAVLGAHWSRRQCQLHRQVWKWQGPETLKTGRSILGDQASALGHGKAGDGGTAAVVQRTHPEGPGNGTLTDTQLGMIGAGEQGTESSCEGGLQIDGRILGGVRTGIRQALESGMQCGVDDMDTSEVGAVAGVAEKGSGNGCDVSCPPPAERTSRRLQPGPRVGGMIIAWRRRPRSDAELCRHLCPGGRFHVATVGHVLALDR